MNKRTPKRLRDLANKEKYVPGIGNLWSTNHRDDWRLSADGNMSFSAAREFAKQRRVTVFRGRTVFDTTGAVSYHKGLTGPKRNLP